MKNQKDKFDGYKKQGTDKKTEQNLERIFKQSKISPLDSCKLFPVFARRQWLKRFLAHYELYKMTLDIPGDIIELGVFKGSGLMTWANLLEIHAIGDRTKKVFGFDNWKGFNKLHKKDGQNNADFQKAQGGFSASYFFEALQQAITTFDGDRFIPWKKRIELINGNIEKTIPVFVKNNPGLRLSLIHFDCDMYIPTKTALKYLWPILSKGGICIFDEYSIHEWPGETAAVDEFCGKKNIIPRKLSWSNTPGAYFVKK
ncbi:MAG: macrocin-O-methyltransferase [Chlamydiae bacterium]|nr:macrocin-O-methyltransferase [Chlamydiota bacterium]